MGRGIIRRSRRRAGVALLEALMVAGLLAPGGAADSAAEGERRGMVEHGTDVRPLLDRAEPPGTERATFALG